MSFKTILITLLFCILFSISAYCQVDSGLVKIRVDSDSVKIVFDDVPITKDQLGNPLIKNSWLIMNVSIGEHRIVFTKEPFDPIDTTIIVSSESVVSLDITFSEKPLQLDETTKEKIQFTITSEPDSCLISINDESLEIFSPTVLFLEQGSNIIELSHEGYQSLAKTVDIKVNQEIKANFILRTSEPPQLTPDSLGLEYASQKSLRSILEAEKIKGKYQSMTEMFAVIPLSQGILAKLIINDNQDKEANLLITVGVVLTLGTYILSKVLYKKRFNEITLENETITSDNLFVEENNRALDIILREKDQERLFQWKRKNIGRGKVAISVIEK